MVRSVCRLDGNKVMDKVDGRRLISLFYSFLMPSLKILVFLRVLILGCEPADDKHVVWMSHEDQAVQVPNGFQAVARSKYFIHLFCLLFLLYDFSGAEKA